MNPISHIVVRDAGAIRSICARSGSGTYLAAGRYDCEGEFSRDGSSYVRLRSAGGDLYLVSERHLLRTPSSVRRVYRGRARQQPGTVVATDNETRAITPEKRREVRQKLWASQPLKQHHLGTYVQFGSMDEWRVEHSIERVDGQWVIHVDGPDDEQSVAAQDIRELINGAEDLGYDTDDLVTDLRETREPQLAALAEEIEAES
jgi:hypothetical protein